ncbi:hypothetical protein XFF6992_650005 [Xanthomonas citri pv. fuscans]|nr:hypothetical protein [Xanthomonas citri]SOO21525.1 hypothetical protein XFF6992_650005 [Xanthomonas citri pv. fuscans]
MRSVEKPNVPITDCIYSSTSIQGRWYGNSELQSVTAKYWRYGLV